MFLLSWPLVLQKLDKEAKETVDKSVEEAKASPEPDVKDLWSDIYYKGTEPPYMRGREREEVCCLQLLFASCLAEKNYRFTTTDRFVLWGETLSRVYMLCS
jgi:hypothetical protein